MTKSRFDQKIDDLLKKPIKPSEVEDRKDKEVEIEVGGITDDGTIYEKVVRPDGNEPIYKEVHIDNDTINTPEATDEKETKKTETPSTTDE